MRKKISITTRGAFFLFSVLCLFVVLTTSITYSALEKF